MSNAISVGDAVNEHFGVRESPDRVLTDCDGGCGKRIEASPMGIALPALVKSMGQRPPNGPVAMCPACYEERRQRDISDVQQKTKADQICWRVFREDWRQAHAYSKSDEEKERIVKRLVATVYQKQEHEELAKEWIKAELSGLNKKQDRRRGAKSSDGAAGF